MITENGKIILVLFLNALLSSDTIVDNISFGKLKGRQDLNRVNDLIKKVELKNFVSKQKRYLFKNFRQGY